MLNLWKAAAAAIVISAPAVLAQTAAPVLKVGDPAPPIQVDEWVKGEPVTEFKDGEVYVVEFWATWCPPCVKSIPHLTKLQKEYKDKGVTIVGITGFENAPNLAAAVSLVKPWVEDKDDEMDYVVAVEDRSNARTVKAYMEAARQQGIPTAFIVDQNQRIAFIGQPLDPSFDKTLADVVAGTFDADASAAAAAAEAALMERGQAILSEVNGMFEAGNFAQGLDRLDDVIAIDDDLFGQIAVTKMQFLMAHPNPAIRDQAKASAFADKLIAELAPENAQLLNQVAWIVASSEEVTEASAAQAVKLAKHANKLTNGDDADILDTLAAAYSASGDNAKAIATQEMAVAKATEAQKADFEERLETYRGKTD